MRKRQISTITAVALLLSTAGASPVWGDYKLVSTGTNVDIPDLGSVTRSLAVSGAPSWARVSKVEYRIRIEDRDDPASFFCGDYEVLLTSSAHSGNVLVYDNLGGSTDGGHDDDLDDDSDVYLNWRTTDAFDGEPVNQTYSAIIRDTMWLDSGRVDYVEFRVYWELQADLFCEDLNISPTPPVPGQSLQTSVTVRNNGPADTGSFHTKFYASQDASITASDRQLGQVHSTGVSAGDSLELSINLAIPSDLDWDDYYIGCIVDATDDVAESNEGNNTASVHVSGAGVGGGGLTGQYFNNINFTNLVMTREDATINFDWGDGSPNPSLVHPETFSVRWTADLIAPATDSFTFLTRSDDGVRLWLDGVLIIDNWTEHAATVDTSCPVALTGGQRYSLRMDMYENGGGAIAELYWESPSLPTQVVPASAFQAPLLAHMPQPANGATNADDNAALTWAPGSEATRHKVYFGTNASSLSYRGQQTSTSYSPGTLQWGQSYYWRIDGVRSNGSTIPGKLWKFTVADYLVVDDFESYTASSPNRIFDVWTDGAADSQNGSWIGYQDAPYVERNSVHEGAQAMPFGYDNSWSSYLSYLSYVERTFSSSQNWTRDGVDVLTLWYKGVAPGSFTSKPGNVQLMTAQGVDIWGTSDQFHYAYRQLAGNGSIQARVLGVTNTNSWAKAGVMIRESLAANSKFAMAIVSPGEGVHFQTRRSTGASATSDTDVATSAEWNATAPLWLKIERNGNTFRAYRSTNGSSWLPMTWNPQTFSMSSNVYVGLCLTSHNEGLTCRAAFSNVQTVGSVSGSWSSRDIGIVPNAPEPMYVQLRDSGGTLRANVINMDTERVLTGHWRPWNIPLEDFSGGLDLTRIKHLRIGLGDPGRPESGGSGRVYFDDIRLGRMAQQAIWIPGEEPPQEWRMTTDPDSGEVIRLYGPLDIVYEKRAVAEQNMGIPRIKVNTLQRTVELFFEPPAEPACAGGHYDPICGVEAWFGPLPAGTWQIFCNQAGAAFSGDFTVSP
ncbi:MAG: DUF1349 domain-containing protein [Sedimentisphaerales bacterium]|nr:DUF1349 domain-containing protein [Sedimentisphaerales bacterium]